MSRIDGRNADQLREIEITQNYIIHAEGSVLIEVGNTKVICTATVEEKVPPWIKGEGKGWVTAEYSMLPRATQTRNAREAVKGKLGGRTMEIQRLVGRALRSVVDLKGLGERTVVLDCDVIQADGGTRTAAINGAFIAFAAAMQKLVNKGLIQKIPLTDYLAAISVGKVNDEILLDLCYEEDSHAQVDMNIVMTAEGKFVEIQGTAEESPFSADEMQSLMTMAAKGIKEITDMQKKVLHAQAIQLGADKVAVGTGH